MRSIWLLFSAACASTAWTPSNAVADPPPSFPLYCQGPLHTTDLSGIPFTPVTRFKWASKGAGAGAPGAGQCAWADRGPRDIEVKPGDSNVICGGAVSNLAPGKFSEIGVFRNPDLNNYMNVTSIVGFVSPPFSSSPVLPSPFNCAWGNDHSCQCGNATGAQLCFSHGGINPALGCVQEQ
jgi:hypothetical protein